jgi:hypothetical protein
MQQLPEPNGLAGVEHGAAEVVDVGLAVATRAA